MSLLWTGRQENGRPRAAWFRVHVRLALAPGATTLHDAGPKTRGTFILGSRPLGSQQGASRGELRPTPTAFHPPGPPGTQHAHTHEHTHMHTHRRTHMCAHMHTHAHTHVCAHPHAHTHAHMHTCTHAHARTCTHTNTRMHTQTRAHICAAQAQSPGMGNQGDAPRESAGRLLPEAAWPGPGAIQVSLIHRNEQRGD